MSDSSNSDQEKGTTNTQEQQRLCDFCGESIALLYCRADSAKLCLTCDRQVHSTNPLFTKHTRFLLCDSCDSSPSSIFCSTHCSVLCQNCDWERHNLSLSSVHDRRPVEGFNGCPSVSDLLANFGLDELGKKNKERLFGCEDIDVGSENFGFSDYLIWETPSVVSLDDLIASSGSNHSFQAMGLPALPKNRNTVCGQHKEEILCQLREMAAKLEPNIDDDQQDIKLSGFRSLTPEQNCQQQDKFTGIEHKTEPSFFPSYEASAFQWCSDTAEDADQGLPTTSFHSYLDTNCIVPEKEKHSEISRALRHGKIDHGEQLQNSPIITQNSQVFPKVVPHELSSQERESAITRYKEKKRSRRYDKHIRYESRKLRAESRTRIKGRFAKMDH